LLLSSHSSSAGVVVVCVMTKEVQVFALSEMGKKKRVLVGGGGISTFACLRLVSRIKRAFVVACCIGKV
jgi:hypothetical protein